MTKKDHDALCAYLETLKERLPDDWFEWLGSHHKKDHTLPGWFVDNHPGYRNVHYTREDGTCLAVVFPDGWVPPHQRGGEHFGGPPLPTLPPG